MADGMSSNELVSGSDHAARSTSGLSAPPRIHAASIRLNLLISTDCAAFHKSCCSCSRSHPSGVRPKTLDSLNAISGLTPALPFRRVERVFRVTPKASAASVTVKFSGSIQKSLMISPGCGGLCMRMRHSFSGNLHNLSQRHRLLEV
jgi:hypothetical protein